MNEQQASEREAFEAWAGSMESWLPNIERRGETYRSAVVAAGWHAWQTRAAASPPIPKVEGEKPTDDEIDRIASDCNMDMAFYENAPQQYWRAFARALLALPKGTSGSDVQSLLKGLVAIWDQKADGRAGSPNHGHAIPGVWDTDNGDLAGMPCAECALYDRARAIAAQAEGGATS